MTEYRVSYQKKPETLTLNMKGGCEADVAEQLKRSYPDIVILNVEPLHTFEVCFTVTVSYSTVVAAVDIDEAKRMVERGQYLVSEEYDTSGRNVVDVRVISEE